MNNDSTTVQEVAIESGRIVFVPIVAKLHKPMDEFCLYLPFAGDKMYVYAQVSRHPRSKHKRVSNLLLSLLPPENFADGKSGASYVGHIWGTYPMLFIGDMIFFYGLNSAREERERALAACKKESRPGGSYRRDSGQVAVSVKLGDKDLRLLPEVSYADGFVKGVRFRIPEAGPVEPLLG